LDALELFVLALALCFVGPTLLWILCCPLPARPKKLFVSVALGIFTSATVLSVLHRALEAPVWLALFLAPAAGVSFALAYHRTDGARSFVSFLSPAPVVFIVYFLFLTPASDWFAPAKTGLVGSSANDTPVVLIILDEMNIAALLDVEEQIDQARFPNFAALVRSSYWFTRATAVATGTEDTMTAILAGKIRTRGKPPSHRAYPNNLFTLLGRTHTLNVAESTSSFCPADLCGAQVAPSRLVLLSDLSILYAHLVLPEHLASGWLPSLEGKWKGFGEQSDEKPKRHGSLFAKLASLRRDLKFQGFIDRINGTSRSLNVLHVLLPHMPMEFLPNGARYKTSIRADFNSKAIWGHSVERIKFHWLRHLKQVGFIDTMLGHLFEKLNSEQMYDKSLIILTADHGVSFAPGQPRRHASNNTVADIFHVPMIVKLPHQKSTKLSARPVKGVDIVATIADVLAVKLPFETDGHSMFADSFPDRRRVWRATLEEATTLRMLPRQIEYFGSGTPLDETVAKGPYDELRGHSVNELDIGEPSPLQVLMKPPIMTRGLAPIAWGGRVFVRPPNKATKIDLAIAVGETIQVTTRAEPIGGDSAPTFAVMLPWSALKDGRPEPRVFHIEAGPTLRRIKERAQPR
jgi:hypothetical protein